MIITIRINYEERRKVWAKTGILPPATEEITIPDELNTKALRVMLKGLYSVDMEENKVKITGAYVDGEKIRWSGEYAFPAGITAKEIVAFVEQQAGLRVAYEIQKLEEQDRKEEARKANYERLTNLPENELGEALRDVDLTFEDRKRLEEVYSAYRKAERSAVVAELDKWIDDHQDKHPRLFLLKQCGQTYVKAAAIQRCLDQLGEGWMHREDESIETYGGCVEESDLTVDVLKKFAAIPHEEKEITLISRERKFAEPAALVRIDCIDTYENFYLCLNDV